MKGITDLNSVIDPRFLYQTIQTKQIKSLASKAKGTDKKKLKEVCYQFESIFINMMLKEMRKTVNKYRLIPRSMAEDIFEDMLYQEYALKMAKSDKFGLAKQIYEQLSKYI